MVDEAVGRDFDGFAGLGVFLVDEAHEVARADGGLRAGKFVVAALDVLIGRAVDVQGRQACGEEFAAESGVERGKEAV
jgi:hypothetical protein